VRHTLNAHANVTDLRPLISALWPPATSLSILPGPAPNVFTPHTANASAITQSSW